MAISSVNAAASYEAPRQVTEVRPVKAEPVMTEVQGTATVTARPVVDAGESEMGAEQEGQRQQNQNQGKMLKSAVSQANNRLKYTQCEFSYHEGTKRVSIKVTDKDTGEVIREIPPEETLEMVQKMWELAGLMVDERR